MERRRKIVFLTPKGARVADKLMDYVIASMPISMEERRRRVSDKDTSSVLKVIIVLMKCNSDKQLKT